MEHYLISNDISGVMVSMLASSVVDRWFKPWSGQAMVGTSQRLFDWYLLFLY